MGSMHLLVALSWLCMIWRASASDKAAVSESSDLLQPRVSGSSIPLADESEKLSSINVDLSSPLYERLEVTMKASQVIVAGVDCPNPQTSPPLALGGEEHTCGTIATALSALGTMEPLACWYQSVINNDVDELRKLEGLCRLRKHTLRATDIVRRELDDSLQKIYGALDMGLAVSDNVASQIQLRQHEIDCLYEDLSCPRPYPASRTRHDFSRAFAKSFGETRAPSVPGANTRPALSVGASGKGSAVADYEIDSRETDRIVRQNSVVNGYSTSARVDGSRADGVNGYDPAVKQDIHWKGDDTVTPQVEEVVRDSRGNIRDHHGNILRSPPTATRTKGVVSRTPYDRDPLFRTRAQNYYGDKWTSPARSCSDGGSVSTGVSNSQVFDPDARYQQYVSDYYRGARRSSNVGAKVTDAALWYQDKDGSVRYKDIDGKEHIVDGSSAKPKTTCPVCHKSPCSCTRTVAEDGDEVVPSRSRRPPVTVRDNRGYWQASRGHTAEAVTAQSGDQTFTTATTNVQAHEQGWTTNTQQPTHIPTHTSAAPPSEPCPSSGPAQTATLSSSESETGQWQSARREVETHSPSSAAAASESLGPSDGLVLLDESPTTCASDTECCPNSQCRVVPAQHLHTCLLNDDTPGRFRSNGCKEGDEVVLGDPRRTLSTAEVGASARASAGGDRAPVLDSHTDSIATALLKVKDLIESSACGYAGLKSEATPLPPTPTAKHNSSEGIGGHASAAASSGESKPHSSSSESHASSGNSGASKGSGGASKGSGGASKGSGGASEASGGASKGSGGASEASGGASKGSGDKSKGSSLLEESVELFPYVDADLDASNFQEKEDGGEEHSDEHEIAPEGHRPPIPEPTNANKDNEGQHHRSEQVPSKDTPTLTPTSTVPKTALNAASDVSRPRAGNRGASQASSWVFDPSTGTYVRRKSQLQPKRPIMTATNAQVDGVSSPADKPLARLSSLAKAIERALLMVDGAEAMLGRFEREHQFGEADCRELQEVVGVSLT